MANKQTSVALALGLAGLALGTLLLLRVPQQPDGDATALAHFAARYNSSPLHTVRHAFWWNLSGALFAWGALGRLLALPLPPRHPHHVTRVLFWAGLLLVWGGWAWNQSRGWQGELFLEPGVATPLGVDRSPAIAFERFLVPPAPSGAGRALALRLLVEGHPFDIAEAAPYRGAGWTLTPRWYGATVQAPSLAEPLFFGADGTQSAPLRDGGAARITVDVETLRATSDPPLPGLHVTHHAILRARFAPGQPLLWLGSGIALLGALLSLLAGRYNGRGSHVALPSCQGLTEGER